MKALLWPALLCSLLGCASGSTGTGSLGTDEGSHRSSGTSARPGSTHGSSSSTGEASSSSSTGTTSVSGSSSGGTNNMVSSSSASSSASGSGGSGNGNCPDVSLPDGGGCPNGAFVSQLVDILSCAPVVGGTVQALDADTVPAPGSVTTAADGTFLMCAPAGSAFTPFVTAATYATTYFAELQADSYDSIHNIEAISQGDLTALGAFLPGSYNPSLGAMLVSISSLGACQDSSGWSFTLTDPDGGPIDDGGYLEAYLGPSGFPVPGQESTSSMGVAFIYDIAISGGTFFSVSAFKPDAGACAPQLNAGGASLSGRIYVTPNAVSADTLITP